MTGGINQDGSAGASRLLPPRDDRETLSALLDGELPGDAARFALKRLSHDVQWRETCGRWQLIGDAMRGEAVAMAPADFAANVARAVDACSDAGHAVAASATTAPAVGLRQGRWIGGAALAASLAIAAVLVVRPFQTAPVTQPTPDLAGAAPAILPTPTAKPEAAATALPAATRLVAGGEAAVPVPAPARSIRARVARPAPSGGSAAAAAPTPEALVAAVAPVGAPGPFQPTDHEITTRPWPRAVLPAAAEGAFTVGLDGASPSSAFYPFEPRPAAPSEPDSQATSSTP